MIKLDAHHESWPIAGSFTISRGSKTSCETVVADLSDGEFKGQGECVPYARYDESVESVLAEIEAVKGPIAEGATRLELQDLMHAGAARNAVDCAMWDFEAKKTGVPAWKLAGLDAMGTLETAYTISLGTPDVMGNQARENNHRPLMKLKLTGDGDIERVAAVHEAAPQYPPDSGRQRRLVCGPNHPLFGGA